VQAEFADMLTQAGWQRKRERIDGRRVYMWRPSK